MGKPTFTINFPGDAVAPCIVEFTSTPQMPEEEIGLFDFGDGTLYNCGEGERIVRHIYQKPGAFLAKGWTIHPKTMSESMVILIRAPAPPPPPPPTPGFWERFVLWLKHLFGG